MKIYIIAFLILAAAPFTEAQTTVPAKPLIYVEQMPTFPGGKEKLTEYLETNIRYPEEALIKKISGLVIVRFVVGADGAISNPRVVRGLGSGCDEEALRLVLEMPLWIPGQHNGIKVPVEYALPIKFSPSG